MMFSLNLIILWIWTLFKRDNFSTRIVISLNFSLIVNRCVFVTRQNFNIRLSVFIHAWECSFTLVRRFSWSFIVIFLDEFKFSFVKRNLSFVFITRLNVKRREIDWNFQKFVKSELTTSRRRAKRVAKSRLASTTRSFSLFEFSMSCSMSCLRLRFVTIWEKELWNVKLKISKETIKLKRSISSRTNDDRREKILTSSILKYLIEIRCLEKFSRRENLMSRSRFSWVMSLIEFVLCLKELELNSILDFDSITTRLINVRFAKLESRVCKIWKFCKSKNFSISKIIACECLQWICDSNQCFKH